MNHMDTGMVVCINSEGYEASLEEQKTYRTLPDAEAGLHGLIRVIDETEEDYLYPASHFVPAEPVQEAEGQSTAA